MSLPQFPVLPGIGWDIKKTPVTSTRVLTAASGVEYRAQNWASPRWKFAIPINFLRQFLAFTEWSTLTGFILEQAGMFANWIYNDPGDNTCTSQSIGVANGSQVAFPLVRSTGGYTQPVLYVNSVSEVYVNGVAADPTTYTITQTGPYGPDTISFNTAPVVNAVITSDFTFFFVCRFDTDEPEFNEFINNIWSVDKIEFESVK